METRYVRTCSSGGRAATILATISHKATGAQDFRFHHFPVIVVMARLQTAENRDLAAAVVALKHGSNCRWLLLQ